MIDQQLQDPEFAQAYQAAGEQVESALALFNLEFKNMNSAPNPWHSKDLERYFIFGSIKSPKGNSF